MLRGSNTQLDRKKSYLQIALNGTLDDAQNIIARLPISDRILIEAGTPLIKRYGENGIWQIRKWYEQRLLGQALTPTLRKSTTSSFSLLELLKLVFQNTKAIQQKRRVLTTNEVKPYIVADLKTMDRGATEVEIAIRGGASAAIALGSAPIETLNVFIEKCEESGLDAMLDMMNVEFPLLVLEKLKKVPPIIILHRGVDEERFNKEKQISLHEIRRIKGTYNSMVSVAGGDTIREVQRSIFNDADIVVVWKSFLHDNSDITTLADQFLKQIK